MNYIEYLANIDKYKGEDHSTFLQHYGILGQKWGQRRWQNADGTFNEAGKERYFGKSSKSSSSDEDKVSGMKSDVQDYLKFRNKMLKKRTRDDLNKWYRENNKASDKQMLRDAKKVDKQREKMYKNQLKDFYDDPNELVSDLDRIYKIGGKEDNPFTNKKNIKEAKKIEDSFYEKTDWPNKGDKALSYNKVEDWLDKPENKDMVDEYNKIWEETCGEKSKEINDLFEEYDNNWRDWRAKAGIYRALTDTTSNKTLGEIGWMIDWYAFDDGDQTDGNSNGLYLSEKGYNDKDINKMFFDARETFDAAEQIASLIPKYNPKVYNMSDKAQNKINEVLNDKMLKKHDYSIYKLTEASDAGDFDKDDLREANKVFNSFKIPKPTNNPNGTKLSGWWFINEAINNLDMASINYKDLTSSDWNKINNEIAKLTDEYNSNK